MIDVPNGTPLSLGVLISGRGSNLQAILNNIKNGSLSASVSVVISNRKDAIGLKHAEEHGVACVFVDRKSFNSKSDYEKVVVSTLKKHSVQLVVLAGYMLLVGPVLLGEYENRVVNIHPSLLPSFPGLDAQKQALEYGVKFSGCTVHFVDEGMDTGPIILQAAVPVLDDDTEESLSSRVLKEEHKLYPAAIQILAEGVTFKGRRVVRP